MTQRILSHVTVVFRVLPLAGLAALTTLPACAAKVLAFESGGSNSSKEQAPDAATQSEDSGPSADAGTDAGTDTGTDTGTGNVDAGGLSCWTGGAAECGCQQTIDGHSYAYSCGAPFVTTGGDDAGPGPVFSWGSCTCTVDGVTTTTFKSTCVNNVELQFTAPRTAPLDGCNFP